MAWKHFVHYQAFVNKIPLKKSASNVELSCFLGCHIEQAVEQTVELYDFDFWLLFTYFVMLQISSLSASISKEVRRCIISCHLHSNTWEWYGVEQTTYHYPNRICPSLLVNINVIRPPWVKEHYDIRQAKPYAYFIPLSLKHEYTCHDCRSYVFTEIIQWYSSSTRIKTRSWREYIFLSISWFSWKNEFKRDIYIHDIHKIFNEYSI